jgi:hypothetical protein
MLHNDGHTDTATMAGAFFQLFIANAPDMKRSSLNTLVAGRSVIVATVASAYFYAKIQENIL